MIFDIPNEAFLSNELFINVVEFETYLSERFGSETECFNMLLNFILQDDAKQKLPTLDVMSQYTESECLARRAFEHIRENLTINDDQEDYLHEIMCYFYWYYSGGLKCLFKRRQADNEGPRIYLKKRITDTEVIDSYLPLSVTAYRGMSLEELNSNIFGMSWTLCKNKAEEFAFTTYSGKPRGVVVKAQIERASILYYDPEDDEKEVVVSNGTVTGGNVVAN
ncbi:MAG: hypothetical protein ACJAXS_000942 [Colwellia sp.]|jgi:hypothetical protein